MRLRRWLWTISALAGTAWGQEQPKAVQKLIEVKYADVDRVASLVQGPGIGLRSDRGMHVIIVHGPPEAVAAVEEMVKKLDVAPPNIEFTVYLVSGLTQGAADDVPKELSSTAKQLHGLFPYKSYRILQSFVLRNRDGREGSTNGSLNSTGASYDFRYRSATVSNGTPRIVHIDAMTLNVKTPTPHVDKDGRVIYNNSSINTDIDAGEGQKVVVGKSSINGSDDALILVVTAKVAE
jgi:hypothetical protein